MSDNSKFIDPYWTEWSDRIITNYGLKKTATGEFHGPCPVCGGVDRFWIKETNSKVKAFCRKGCDIKQLSAAMRADSCWPDATRKDDWFPPMPATNPFTDTTAPQHDDSQLYHERKGVPLFGAQVQGDKVVVRILDINRQTVGFQTISPTGDKRFTKGMAKDGSFSVINGPLEGVCYIAEGWATAASVSHSTGRPCVFALDAGNLPKVASLLIEARPKAEFVVAADNDEKGIAAAKKTNLPYVTPDVAGADWNDIMLHHGADYVAQKLKSYNPLRDVSWPTPIADVDPFTLPRRKWVYGNTYIRNFVTVTASAGGIGKTSLTAVEALAIATGRNLLEQEVKEQTNVWLLNLEDPLEEMQLRVAAAMQHYGIKYADVSGKLFMDAEDTIEMTFATETRDGLLQNDELLAYMTEKIKSNNIGVVIIDPFVSTHMVNENSNAAIQAVVAMFRKLARDTGAAIHLVHHVRKGNGDDSTIDSVRGAGSLIGAARAARVLNRVSEAKAIELGVPQIHAMGILRIDDGKANLAPPAEAAIYARMVGVKLPNDEWVGVATHFKLPDEWEGMDTKNTNAILSLIGGGFGNGELYSIRPQDKERWAGHVIMNYKMPAGVEDKTEGQAKMILKKWLETGLIEVGEYWSESQRKDRKGITFAGHVGDV